MKALILAAGYGTRLKPYTEATPKACMPFFNLPQILYNIELLKQAGVTDIIINTHHLADVLVDTLTKYKKNIGLNISYSHELELLNSGGGIKNTVSFFEGADDFFVINADTMMLPKDIHILKSMMGSHKNTKALVTMGTVNMSESLPEAKESDSHFAHRALWVEHNKVKDINKERVQPNTKPKHFSGCYIFSNKVFELFPQKEEFHIFDGLIYEQISKNNVCSYFFEDTYWFETGNKDDFIEAHESILKLFAAGSANTSLLEKTWEKHQPKSLKQKTAEQAHKDLLAFLK